MLHTRYFKEEEIKAEVERLEKCRAERNEQADKIRNNPNKQKGWAFLATKDNDPWTYEQREFPE